MNMKINYNLTGTERKSLVAAISQELNAPTKYLGAPTFAYQIGDYIIDRNGVLEGENDEELVGNLFRLYGFEAVTTEYDAPTLHESRLYKAELCDPESPERMEVFSADDDEDAIRQAYAYCEGEVVLLELDELDEDYNIIRSVDLQPNPYRLSIEVPLDGFTPERLDNLHRLVDAKAPLIKAALNAERLPILQTGETLRFPWFDGDCNSEHTAIYAQFIHRLCRTAQTKARITAKAKDHENPKYAMRCFLLSLGMIGNEYKLARKVLLSRLEGNSAWKNVKKAGVTCDE